MNLRFSKNKRMKQTMKNFVFISPNFPVNYWQFSRQLRNTGLPVLGIGDHP